MKDLPEHFSLALIYIYIYDQPGPSGEQKFAERKWTEMLDETGSQESGVSWLHMLNG